MKAKTLTLALVLAILGLAGVGSSAQAQDKTFANSLGMQFVLIPAGSFMMGADSPERDEGPVHKVTISRPFYMGKHEVTQAQWEAVMGNNPSIFKGRNNPVERVSWDEVQVFIGRLNEKEGHSRYRLPTEAEWEYAARAGTNSAYFFGDDVNELSRYAWYHDNSGRKTHPVGQKLANAWGLYDVYGNVWEWVQDWYVKKYYSNSPGTDPKGPSSGSYRVFRGGCWGDAARGCRSASRDNRSPVYRFDFIGFRLALSIDQ